MDKHLHVDWVLCVLSRALFDGFDQKGFEIEEMKIIRFLEVIVMLIFILFVKN